MYFVRFLYLSGGAVA